MERLQANIGFLKSLCKGDCNDIKAKLKKASPEEIKTIVDVTLNVMKKRIPMSKKGVNFVKAKRRELCHVLDPKYSLNSKKRFITQRGGGIFAPLMGMLLRGGLARSATGLF